MKADELEFFSQIFEKMQKNLIKSQLRNCKRLSFITFPTIVTNKAQDMLDGKITSTKLLGVYSRGS